MERDKMKERMHLNEKTRPLILQLQKRKWSQRQDAPQGSNDVNPVQMAATSHTRTNNEKQKNVAPTDCPPILRSETTEQHVRSIISLYDKDNHMQRPFSVFEKGSTSRPSNEQYGIPSEPIRPKGHTQKMEDQVPISAITPATMNWTCKIIVVDKLRPKTSRDQKVKFQTIIVQDENEEQICIILYGANIYKYRKRFKLFHTYLISTAKVRDPSIYAIRLNKFEWLVDAFTIVEAVPEDTENENELPPPTKLNPVSFLDFEERTPGVEIGDLLAVVANISTVKYISDDKRRQDLIVIDKTRKPVFFTIWANLTDYEGKDLLQKVQEYQEHPVIVAKRISVSHYRGCRFATRFNSTISIDPPYPQAKELMNWAKENEQLLITYILKSSSDSPTELNLAPFEDEIVSTSTIPVASSEQTFFLEGEMSLTNDLQTFYVLVCSDCKHMVRHRQQKEVTCINCEQRKMLIPSCEFEVEITDGSGTVSAIISEKLAESILAMTAAEVYETTVVKHKLLPVQHITEQLANKTFKIHLQKSQSRSPDKEVGTLVVLSYTRTHTMFDSPESSATMTIDERTKRNIECVTFVEEDHSSSAKRQKVEPTTPRKKQ